MRAGLAASTVTPGSTAPDASFTTPVSSACAKAMVGTTMTESNRVTVLMSLRIGGHSFICPRILHVFYADVSQIRHILSVDECRDRQIGALNYARDTRGNQ